MTRCNKRLGQFQKVCCIRMEGHGGLHRARWQGLGGKYVTERTTDGAGSNGVSSSQLVLNSRLMKGKFDG